VDELGVFLCRHHSATALHAHTSRGDEQWACCWPQFRDVVSPHRHDDRQDHRPNLLIIETEQNVRLEVLTAVKMYVEFRLGGRNFWIDSKVSEEHTASIRVFRP
jgi:hypothetical protein